MPTATPSVPTLLEVCQAGWQGIASNSELDLQQNLERGLRLLTVRCLTQMKQDLKVSLVQNFVTSCQLELEGKPYTYIQDSCVPLLRPFRAFIIRNLRAELVDFGRLDETDLANQLLGGSIDLKRASVEDLQRNIQTADAIIAQDRNFYPAYKAKLLGLLIQELKYGSPQDMANYQELYNELLSFQGSNQANQSLPETLSEEGGAASTSELADIDSDLIHIPFLRLSALGDTEGLATMAEEYIEAYPNSSIGYMYLADAAWKAGDQATAVNTFKKVMGQDVSDEAVLQVLSRMQSKKPLDTIMEMKL